MAKINVIIADTDAIYLNHLSNYLMQHMDAISVFTFTAKENLEKFLNENTKKIDVIAVTEDLLDETVIHSEISVKILLTDGTLSDYEEIEAVNKYQRAGNFVSDILTIYAEKTGHIEAVISGDKKTEIIGVYSPVGGSGKTTVSAALSAALAAGGKKVFYLNAEKINSTANIFNHADNGNMSDVYLAAISKGDNIGLKIVSNKYVDPEWGISYINPSESSLEINEVSTEKFLTLMNEFEKLGEFDYVIIDFDSEFSKYKAEVLKKCDKIVMPVVDGVLQTGKINLFVKELGMYEELGEILRKSIIVHNRKETNGGNVVIDGCEPTAAIPMSPILNNITEIPYAISKVMDIMSEVIVQI